MTSTNISTCNACGARIADDAEQCDLCGASTSEDAIAEVVSTEVSTNTEQSDLSVPENEPSVQTTGVFCNQCGWKNPGGSRFCSQCGSRLQEISSSLTAPVAETASAAPDLVDQKPEQAKKREELPTSSRQVGIILGTGVLLVIVLFLVTAISREQATRPVVGTTPAATPPAGAQSAPTLPASSTPLPPFVAEQSATLEAEIETLTGEEKLAKQQELITLFLTSGRLDKAAPVQKTIAQELDSPDVWRRTGDLYYDWMRQLEDEGRKDPVVAQEAISAYQRVLEVEPNNLDVRTDMATAFLSSNNPMQGVQEIKKVLDVDPNHVQARFNYGIMLAMIGRAEQALEQFENVKTLVGTESPFFQQAVDAIRSIEANI